MHGSEFPETAIRKAGYHAVWNGQRHGMALPSWRAARADPDPHRLAWRSSRHQAATSRPRSTACSSAASICRTAIRSPGRNSTTSSPGSSGCTRTRDKLLRRKCPSCSPAITTSRRPRSTSIRPNHGTTTRSCSPRAARPMPSSSSKAGPTALRKLHPGERIYTFWHYMRHRWERDAGLRLDHLLLSPSLAPRLEDAGVDRAVRGKAGASDHAPVWIALGAQNRAAARRAIGWTTATGAMAAFARRFRISRN